MISEDKQSAVARAIAFLEKANVSYVSHKNGTHLMIHGATHRIDFWPTTGKWRTSQTSGNGLTTLQIELDNQLEHWRKTCQHSQN